MTDAPDTTWIIELDHETREILAEQGHEAPASVTLRLRDANLRDLRAIEPLLARAQTDNQASFEAGAVVITRRADPAVSIEVAREIVQQLFPHELADLIVAYRTGERDRTGKLKAAVQTTLSGVTDTLLSALAAGPTPSNSGSTA